MSTKYNANLFDSLKEALSNKNNYDSNFKDFLKFDIDKTYIVRLIPNVEDINNTWYAYKQHIWESCVHGKKVSTLCPNTYKQKCPICEHRSKIWATKNKTLIDQINPLKSNKRWLYNVYVIKDPTNPENEGKIKYLNAGAQLEAIIESARSGDDSEEYGFRIFDLSENGCNLRIKVEKNDGGYPKYTSSRFLSASAIEGLDSEDAIDAVYSSFKSLDTIFKRKSYDEVKDLLDVHFLGKDKSAPANISDSEDDDFKVDLDSSNDDDEISSGSSVSESSESDQEKRMKAILEDL
jgi:hypothetical protein